MKKTKKKQMVKNTKRTKSHKRGYNSNLTKKPGLKRYEQNSGNKDKT